jgi:uncharacterized protein YjiS (DUF1127 family)
MATQIVRNPSVVGGSAAVPGVSLFDRLAAAWNDYWRLQRTRHELESLTDRELADIGLHRADIDLVVRQGRSIG